MPSVLLYTVFKNKEHMPKQVNTAIVTSIDGLIYYKRGNDYLVRAKGNTGRQADVAKKKAGILGKASAISARRRSAFRPVIMDTGSRKLMYRFNNLLQQWLRSGQHQ